MLSPFQELAGGELNFSWAYREATALHRQQASRQSFGGARKLASRRGGDQWSTRLSDAHRTFTSELQHFPLQFRDNEAESEYVAVTNYQSSLRFSVYLLLQHCLLLPTQFALLLWDADARILSFNKGWLLHPLIFAFCFVTVFGLILAISLLYPHLMPRGVGYYCRAHAAQVACVYSFCYTGFMSAALIAEQTSVTKELEHQLLQQKPGMRVGVSIMGLITETSIFYLYVFSTNLLFMDLIGPILTKWTMVLHLLTAASLTAPFITGFVDGRLFSLCTFLAVATIATILTAMAYAGRLSGELQHRLLFLQWRKSRLRLMELLHEQDDTSKTRTAMENVVGELEQCGKILQQMRNIEHDFGEEFHEVFRIVSECRRTLLTGEKLYTVNIGKADRFSKHYLQLYSHYGGERVDQIQSWSHQRSLTLPASSRRPQAPEACEKSASHVSCDSGSDSADEPVKKQSTPQWKKLLDAAERNMNFIGTQWSFSVLQLDQEVNEALFVVGAALLGPVVTDWGCCSNELCQFLHTLQRQYQPNPYHNQLHAAMVGHAAVSAANMLGIWQIMEPLEKAALVVASLAHDVGHPGRTNQFFVASFDPLAIIYNDISPLENFHSCLCFRILEKKSCNIFFMLSVGGFRFARAKIIECILSTDMKQHFEDISKFRMRRQSEEFSSKNSVEDRWATLRMCVKLGDVCHTALPWSDHFIMSCAITEEFYQQGDEELRRGMSVSPLCSREAKMDIAKSQESFLSFVARPLVAELVELDSHKLMAAEVLSTLDANMGRWKTMAAEGTPISLPATNKQTQVRTFTLQAVRSLAGPALSLVRHKTAGNHDDQWPNQRRGVTAAMPPSASSDDTLLGTHLFYWLANSSESMSGWSPRFTVDSVLVDKIPVDRGISDALHQKSSNFKAEQYMGSLALC
ncbi:phosphodiesterase, putative [Eimeria brunetti]|uniref:Phosphodiesterase n=1 Tax=Eimeria brunetti TaxID=51314 RepID=U6LUA9_9EIME|nr:phosphodiesterase, putative [Eimeria brunetti]